MDSAAAIEAAVEDSAVAEVDLATEVDLETEVAEALAEEELAVAASRTEVADPASA